jgi:hypothetical protein
MNEDQEVVTFVLEQLEEASAINKTVQLLMSAKATGQDLLFGDSESLGFLLILEQLGQRLNEAISQLERWGGGVMLPS